MGEGSKIVLLGDIEQIDTPYIDGLSNGLTIVVEKFKNHSKKELLNIYQLMFQSRKLDEKQLILLKHVKGFLNIGAEELEDFKFVDFKFEDFKIGDLKFEDVKFEDFKLEDFKF